MESQLRLQGWTRERRVIVQRRKLAETPQPKPTQGRQSVLPGLSLEQVGGEWYEHAVLVTSWEEPEIMAVAQAYRDRADAENMFDELKNQWGWTGFSTQDLKRSQLMARIVALVFNWWSIFTRIGTGDKHGEAITTRPMLMHGVARRTSHGGQKYLSLSSLHAKAKKVAQLLAGISGWLSGLKQNAEQLGKNAAWPGMLRTIFRFFYGVNDGRHPQQARV